MLQTTQSANGQVTIKNRRIVVGGRFVMGKVLLGSVIALLLASAFLLVTNGDRLLDIVVSKDVQEAVSRLSWKWRKRSSVKIAERTYEKRAQALHC